MYREYEEIKNASMGYLSVPLKTWVVFTRFDFGLSAVTPATLFGGVFWYAIYHDTYDVLLHTHDLPFFHGPGIVFAAAFVAAGLVQMGFAWLMYFRNKPQLSHYLGTPFLNRPFRLPFRLAWLLDIALMFCIGSLVQANVDEATGTWLLFGSVGGLMIFVTGTQQAWRDRMNMIDAGNYSGMVVNDVKKRTGKAKSSAKPAAKSEHIISTGE